TQTVGDMDDVLGVVHVVLGEIPMAQVDAALVVDIVRGHVVGADLVVDTVTRPTHGGHDVVARTKLSHVGPHGFYPSEALVPDDQEVISRGRCPVFRGVDLLVGSVNADT